ncbi:COP9 signalosome complex subunit 6 [Escovopsis weberi]|uniref:COP9 signalosome complex subunit 6 n=1 Tax=Escovopsis weberi TaxID=150374 RepID=A0A0N0RT27_ESCWE|nr:COP9 signalosome complex subunit 6 [Escovopsis weberi]
MDAPGISPLVSSQKSSQLQAVLHPLVLLTISDYITRHTLRQMKGPVIGALLGQQNSREITIEHAFECHTRMVNEQDESAGYVIDQAPFYARLEQMVTVHQDRHLDIVGWYTVFPAKGPTGSLLPVHKQIRNINDSAVLLGFHPEQVVSHNVGGKLPLTIYESYFEMDDAKVHADTAEDRKMDDDSGAGTGRDHTDADTDADDTDDGEALFRIRFREVPYSVETDETEMISMNYVAEGGGSAAAASSAPAKEDRPARSIESNGKGKRRLVEAEAEAAAAAAAAAAAEDRRDEPEAPEDPAGALTRAEQETLAALTAKANAIKMLHSRIQLMTAYLERLPPAFTGRRGGGGDAGPAEPAEPAAESMDTDHTTPSWAILRQIQALVSRLGLVIPADREAYEREVQCESNNVQLVGLLNSILQGASEARDVGRKFHVIEAAAAAGRRGNADYGSGLYGMANTDLIL